MVELDSLCYLLNRLHQAEGPLVEGLIEIPGEKENWILGEKVIEKLCGHPLPKRITGVAHAASVFEPSIRLFKKYFKGHMKGELGIKVSLKKPFTPISTVQGPQAVGSYNIKQDIAFQIWDLIFFRKGYERVRRCKLCKKWFAAPGKNKIAEYCKKECHDAWWSRNRRRNAGHRHQKLSRNPKKGD